MTTGCRSWIALTTAGDQNITDRVLIIDTVHYLLSGTETQSFALVPAQGCPVVVQMILSLIDNWNATGSVDQIVQWSDSANVSAAVYLLWLFFLLLCPVLSQCLHQQPLHSDMYSFCKTYANNLQMQTHEDFFTNAQCQSLYKQLASAIVTRTNSINGRR